MARNALIFCALFWTLCFSKIKAERLKLGVFLDSEANYFANLNSTEPLIDFEIVRVNQLVTPYNSLNDLINDVEKYRQLALTAMIGNYSYLGSILADQLNIPYYVLNFDLNSAQKRNMFQVDFSDNVLTEAYKAMVNYNSYETILIITDNFQRSDLFRKMFTGRYLNSLVLKGDYSSDLEQNLLNARANGQSQAAFILAFEDTNQFMIEAIFNRTLFMNMMNSINLWLIPDLYCNPKYLLPFARNVANIVTFAVTNTTLNNSILLREAILRDSFLHLMTAFINKGSSSLINQVQKTTVNGYTGYVTFDDNRKRVRLNLNVMTARKSMDRLIKIGEWLQDRTPYSYFNTYNGALLRDINVRIGIYSKRPFIYRKKNGEWDGFGHLVFLELAKRLNFQFTYIMIPDNSIGSFNNVTQTWNGAMRMLQNNLIDICGIPGSTNRLRISTNFADFSGSVLDSGYNILVSVAKQDEWDFIKLFTPFSWFVWFTIIILGLYLTFILWIIDKISPNDGTESIYSFASAGFVVFGAFVMAKMSRNPHKASSHVFFFFVRLGSLLILACYAANLTGYLIKPAEQSVFTDLKTLYTKGSHEGYKWIFRNGSVSVSNLFNSGGIYADLVTRATKGWPDTMFVSGDDYAVISTLTNDINRKTVLINDGLENDFMQYGESQNCLVKTVGSYETDISLVFYMRHNLPQSDLLKQEIQKMVDSKLMGKYREMYFKAGICTEEHIESIKIADSLSIKYLIGIFILLGVGLVIAAVIVLLEFVINKIALCLQRSKYSKLQFGSTYNCTVVSIEANGICVQLPEVSAKKNYFVCVNDLGDIANSKQSIEDSGIQMGKKIKLVYRGNDPHSGAKKFVKYK